MSTTTPLRSTLLGITSAVVLLAACVSSHDPGSHDSGSHDSGSHDSGSYDSGSHDSGSHDSGTCSVAEAAGQSVLVDCAQIIQVVDAGNGFGQQPPTGSTCGGAQSYTVDLAMRKLHWSNCDQSLPLWTPRSGDHSLSQSEYDTLLAALKKVVITTSTTSCGADKPTITITVDTGNGKQTYTDSFYACTGIGKPYVDNIDGVLSELFPLAK